VQPVVGVGPDQPHYLLISRLGQHETQGMDGARLAVNASAIGFGIHSGELRIGPVSSVDEG
jgi:hypothetical protein